MSATTPSAGSSGSQQRIVLPPGVTVSAGSETSQLSANGQIQQGTNFPVKLPDGTTTSVFVPHSMLSDIGQVQRLFDTRIQALSAIVGG